MEPRPKLVYLPIEKLELWDEANVRKSNALFNIEELVTNIRELGVRFPLLVKKAPNDKYLVFSGQRRLEASKIARLREVPCLVYTHVTPEVAKLISLSENMYREPMTPDDISDAASILQEHLGSISQVAKCLGVSPSTVRRYLGYRHVPSKLKSMVSQRRLTPSQAMDISAKFPVEEKAVRVAEEYTKLTKKNKPKFFRSITLANSEDDIPRLHERAKSIDEKIKGYQRLLIPEKDSLMIEKIALESRLSPEEVIVRIIEQWLEDYERGIRRL